MGDIRESDNAQHRRGNGVASGELSMQRSQLVLLGGLAAGLLLFAVFPPLDLRVLAPLAPIPLLYALAWEGKQGGLSAWQRALAG
ncbi:MAG: hypothetical protein ABSE21_16400, partial [Bryobacteraceae bacterium]